MKYRLVTPELEALIAGIQRKIRLSMNGIVSEQMTQSGIIYKKNYGVSIPRIKEIASLYTPNHDLAQQLWHLQIRETMIMATLLEPIESFTPQDAGRWVADFNQIEIAEQACMNLFCNLSFSNSLSKEWISSGNSWVQITGFILAARITAVLSQPEIDAIINKALKTSETDNFHLYKAIALCLSRFCRKNKETSAYILKEIAAFPQTPSVGQHYISTEVKQEILFLGIL
ncbi:MAG: DNA alkylation repair protein [Bacteroidota bacterium]|nr:DNA alkylation repair protein [Bacteroidota bacterium]